MIVYFADRKMNILGQASTTLPKGLMVTDDTKDEDVDSGVAVFECEFGFDADTRAKIEACVEVGNYILRKHDDENEFYTIIDSEVDTKKQTAFIYAEDAGLDLLNEIVGAYEADKAYPIEHYIEQFAYDSGFVIGINEAASLTRELSWDGEDTVTARLASVATQFDGCEISFSFDIKNLRITSKKINIYKKRGKDIGTTLRLNKEIDNIVVKKTIVNVATALRATGGTPEVTNTEDDIEPVPITLRGYEYDDGDFYVDGDTLKCRSALKKWSRYINPNEQELKEGHEGHIVRPYSYDTLSQAELCAHTVTELKKLIDAEVNYEADILYLPENTKIGDRVNIVDEAGELFLSTRLLQLKSSVVRQEQKATLGEFLIKKSGISDKVLALADQFAVEAAANRKARAEAAKKAAEAEAIAKEAAEKAAKAEAELQAAQQAAEEAQRLVDEAKAQADAAAKAAAEAKAEAAAASASVEIAQSAAETATTKAEEAKSTADTAKADAEDAKTTAMAAKLDAEQAKADVAALGENLETVQTTMQADYARKTELTETEATLQSQISQNAAQISSTVESVTRIDETANNAKEQAEAAKTNADAAKAAADQAAANLGTAAQAAYEAQKAAYEAQVAADTANNAADEAERYARESAAKLTQAEADLESAVQNLEEVNSKVDATEEEIAEAQAAVDKARAAADAARADAEQAQSDADQARADANTATQIYESALQSAEEAQAVADEARKAAEEAQAAVADLAVRVTTAETNIAQNSEQIALRAKKTEVTEAIADVQIGGRNLLLNSNTLNGDNISTNFSATGETYAGTNIFSYDFSAATSGTSDSLLFMKLYPEKLGEQYTLSFYAKGSGNMTTYFYGASGYLPCVKVEQSNGTVRLANDGNSQWSLTEDWSRYWVTWTLSDTGDISIEKYILFRLQYGAVVSICGVKLEKGNKATDWTPAPEDMATGADIEAVNGEIASVYESVASLDVKSDNIAASVAEIKTNTENAIDSANGSIETLTNEVNAKMTAEAVEIKIRTAMENGATKVDTTTGVTVDADGITVDKTGSEMKTNISENGMSVYQNEEKVLEANNTGVDAKNLHATTYLIVGGRIRFENYGDNRTGCFWIGG